MNRCGGNGAQARVVRCGALRYGWLRGLGGAVLRDAHRRVHPPRGQRAQATGGDQATPSNFNWEIKDGKRVPKGQRQVNPDGSWREVIRQGKCQTVKEKSAAGEYKETRTCDQ